MNISYRKIIFKFSLYVSTLLMILIKLMRYVTLNKITFDL